MEFIAVKFTSIPTLYNAHIFEASEHSQWYMPQFENLIEITAIEQGSLMTIDLDNSEKQVRSEGEVFTTLHKKKLFSETVGDKHRHVTFSIVPEQITYDLTESDVLEMSARIYDQTSITAIIPIRFEKELASSMNIKIRQIIDNEDNGDVFRNLKITSIIMDILSMATECSLHMAEMQLSGTKHYNHTFYCQQAMKYIAGHICEEIEVEKVAESMNVSYGHLSRLFKQQTGQTLVDYINREKVRKMEELLWTKKMSVSEVSQSVGISDEKYASRLFKKYSGLTIGQYVKLNRNNPQAVINPDKIKDDWKKNDWIKNDADLKNVIR